MELFSLPVVAPLGICSADVEALGNACYHVDRKEALALDSVVDAVRLLLQNRAEKGYQLNVVAGLLVVPSKHCFPEPLMRELTTGEEAVGTGTEYKEQELTRCKWPGCRHVNTTEQLRAHVTTHFAHQLMG